MSIGKIDPDDNRESDQCRATNPWPGAAPRFVGTSALLQPRAISRVVRAAFQRITRVRPADFLPGTIDNVLASRSFRPKPISFCGLSKTLCSAGLVGKLVSH
jgi:hypothetical protein